MPWAMENSTPATLPMALLTAIVRKEALLPEHTAAFAATQLLPVIQAATERHLAATRGQQFGLPLSKELLVSATNWLPSLRLHACVSCTLRHADMRGAPPDSVGKHVHVTPMGMRLRMVSASVPGNVLRSGGQLSVADAAGAATPAGAGCQGGR